ncbi:MAG: DUF4330 family protein [Clostridia bacterium]|nr:DUF4330 family protein [Clostridia bacterium]
MNNENKINKKKEKNALKFNAVDFCVIAAVVVIVLALVIRFIPVDRLTETRKSCNVVLSVSNIPSSVAECAKLGSDAVLYNEDGTVFGKLISFEEKQSVLGYSASGEAVYYPAGTVSDITVTVSCDLKIAENGRYLSNGARMAAGSSLSVLSGYSIFDAVVISVMQQD